MWKISLLWWIFTVLYKGLKCFFSTCSIINRCSTLIYTAYPCLVGFFTRMFFRTKLSTSSFICPFKWEGYPLTRLSISMCPLPKHVWIHSLWIKFISSRVKLVILCYDLKSHISVKLFNTFVKHLNIWYAYR